MYNVISCNAQNYLRFVTFALRLYCQDTSQIPHWLNPILSTTFSRQTCPRICHLISCPSRGRISQKSITPARDLDTHPLAGSICSWSVVGTKERLTSLAAVQLSFWCWAEQKREGCLKILCVSNYFPHIGRAYTRLWKSQKLQVIRVKGLEAKRTKKKILTKIYLYFLNGRAQFLQP